MNKGDYYTIILVSLTSLLPVIYGIVFSFFYSEGQKTLSGKASLARMIYLFILNFLSVLVIIRIADPVSTEGWLRTLFILILFSAESVFVYSFLSLSFSKTGSVVYSVISLLFLAAVPVGLILHHPWNYILFFSPLYWLSWAWIIPSVAESAAYAAIALILTTAYLLIASWLLQRKPFA